MAYSLLSTAFLAGCLVHGGELDVVAKEHVWTECIEETAWLDRDNPSGDGDYELYHLWKNPPCGDTKPVSVDCERISDGKPFDPSDFAPQNNAYCGAKGNNFGFACTNTKGRLDCPDYRVKFCCKQKYLTCQADAWTGWLDRDNPSGDGDFEQYKDFCVTDGKCPCDPEDPDAPYYAKCALANDVSNPFSSGDPRCTKDGIYCRNTDDSRCPDYAVNFCCKAKEVPAPTASPTAAPSLSPTTAPTSAPTDCPRWTAWYDRDNPSGNGDYELYGLSVINKPCGDVGPLFAECRSVKTKQSFDDYMQSFDPSIETKYCNNNGFACVNPGITTVCPDFEVRFCCAK